MNISDVYMQRCINLAKLGEGHVAPNPMVGSVIVHNNKIIGEGFHQKYGGLHAEVNAINSVNDQSLLKHATLYVNLEPCAHFGKTPPCSDLIIKKGIPKVIIGTIDPFAKVAGLGIEKMKRAGIKVDVGILNTECLDLNRRFFTFHQKKRPYIILKWAQTADGFVDIDRSKDGFGQPTWITNEMARIAVHKQRANENAILIGTETALKDNPSLTLRDWYGVQAIRIVPDRKNRLPISLNIFNNQAKTLVIANKNYSDNRKTTLIECSINDNTINALVKYLYNNEIQSIIIEGGPTMLQSFIDQNLWDEAHIYTGQICFESGVKAPIFNNSPAKFDQFYNSELRIYRNV